jgi:3-oxoacyl-[acyl-carrier protein] reductase
MRPPSRIWSAARVAELKAQGSRAFAIRANAGDAQDAASAVRRVAEQYRGIDILVHNAGVAGFAPLPESDFADYRPQFAVNVDGVFAASLFSA